MKYILLIFFCSSIVFADARQGSTSSGANKTLSNLGTTAINADLIPGTNGSISIGKSDGTESFLNLWIAHLLRLNTTSVVVDVGSGILQDGSGTRSVHWDNHTLYNTSGVVNFNYSGSAPALVPQPAGTPPPSAAAGMISLTSGYKLCVYNGSSWKNASDGSTSCSF